jgi:hypothetical protein
MAEPTAPRPRSILPLIASAVCAILIAQMAWKDPRYLVPFFAITIVMLMPGLLARWRMRRLLMSGDVKRVLGTWQSQLERATYPETMAPLMAATAYAAYGWTDAARGALDRAVKGPAWDAAIEQRLFVETLLDAFEGERDAAMNKAQLIEGLPPPSGAGWLARRRVKTLRRGLGALTRAFAHASRDGDMRMLERAAAVSPLVHWAMRYAAAIVAIDRGRAERTSELLNGAPEWPGESAFATYHAELLARAAA